MKLTKAVEILELNIKEAGSKMPPDCKVAVQMGIEAMKAVQTLRDQKLWPPGYLLPGETEQWLLSK